MKLKTLDFLEEKLWQAFNSVQWLSHDRLFSTPWTAAHQAFLSITNSQSLLTQKQRHRFADKGPSHQSYGFSGSHIWMWELDHKEGWMPKNWCFQTVVLEKTIESPLDSKDIKPVDPIGNQSWMFIGRTDAEAEAPILWVPLWQTADSLEKTMILGKIEGRRKRGPQRMRRLDGIMDSMNMGLTKPGVIDSGQESLARCSPQGLLNNSNQESRT